MKKALGVAYAVVLMSCYPTDSAPWYAWLLYGAALLPLALYSGDHLAARRAHERARLK